MGLVGDVACVFTPECSIHESALTPDAAELALQGVIGDIMLAFCCELCCDLTDELGVKYLPCVTFLYWSTSVLRARLGRWKPDGEHGPGIGDMFRPGPC